MPRPFGLRPPCFKARRSRRPRHMLHALVGPLLGTSELSAQRRMSEVFNLDPVFLPAATIRPIAML